MFQPKHLTEGEVRFFYGQPLKRLEGVLLEAHMNALMGLPLSEEQQDEYLRAACVLPLLEEDLAETLAAMDLEEPSDGADVRD